MLNKFLLIGVGGSGGKTLRYTWRELERRLDATKWDRGIPRAWQFLHIDVPEQPDIEIGNVPVDVGAELRYLNLADQSHDYAFFDSAMVKRGPLEAIAGWRPDPVLRDIKPPFKGAGQLRAVGRVIAVAQIARIGQAVETASRALFAEGVDEELAKLNDTIGATTVSNNQPTVVVFASLAGGSGSGAVLDVVELLKSLAPDVGGWLNTELMTLLYTADAFPDLAKARTTGIEPNSLAALAEFINGYEHTGDVPPFEEQLVAPGGGVGDPVGRRTGSHNFFVGARNADLEFEYGNDVYQAIGKAFAAFMANDAVQADFHTYGFNATAAPIMAEFPVTDATGICRSMGYSNVSLGRSLFASYAEERLAKNAIERLLRGYEDVPPEEKASIEVLLPLRVAALSGQFFSAAGLWEHTKEHNEVLDELRSQKEKAKALDDLRDGELGKLAKSTRKAKIAEWLGTLGTNFETEARKFVARETEERIANARKWVPRVEGALLDATAAYIGHYGLILTLGLLDALSAQLTAAVQELLEAQTQFNHAHETYVAKARSAFQGKGASAKDKVATSHPGFTLFAQLRREALHRTTEAALYGYAADLLRDLNRSMVSPLRTAVSGALNSLETGASSVELSRLIAQWSTTVTPPHLTAAPNEVLLEKEGGFPKQLERLLDEMFPGAGAAGAEKRALSELIRGGWPSTAMNTTETGPQTLIEARAHWLPTEPTARNVTDSASTGEYRLELGPKDVLSRASAWVHDREGKISEDVHLTLSGWLADPERGAQRAGEFAAAFKIAHKRSAPLIAINQNVHLAVHGEGLPVPTAVIGKLPIESSSRAYDPIVTYLRSAGLTDAQIKGLFDPNSTAQEVEISSFLGWSVHPVVMSSVTVPIQQKWNEVKRSTARKEFWSLRRARPLGSFIPLSSGRQDAMVRGWFVARALGHLGNLSGPWNGAGIWTPRGTRRLPAILLGAQPKTGVSALPALLESYALALISYGSGDSAELEAYGRLIELGGMPNEERAEVGEEVNSVELSTELLGWLETGNPSAHESNGQSAPKPDPAIAGASDGTPEERRAALHAWVSERGAVHQEQINKYRLTAQTTLQLPRGWEIRDLVAGATQSLAETIAEARLQDRSGGLTIADPYDEVGA